MLTIRNLKTCHGLETHLFLNGAWVQLKELPELLRSLPRSEIARILEKLLNRPANGANAPAGTR